MRAAFGIWSSAALVWVLGTGSGPAGVTVATSGELDGYLTPCGCSTPMVGGMMRRANLIKSAAPLVRIDNGDLTAAGGRQDEIKAETAIELFNAMGYDAIGLGEKDFALGLDFLRSLQARFKGALLCANAVDDAGKPLFADHVTLQKEADGKKVRIDVMAVLSPSVASGVKLEPATAALDRLAPKLTGDLAILLYHGPRAEAETIAKWFPKFRMIVSAHDSDDALLPRAVGATQLVSSGKSGKHLGLATFSGDRFKTAKLEDRELGPELGENAAAAAIMSLYGERVAAENLLALVPKGPSPNGDTYAGSRACATCHASAAEAWTRSKHAKAYAILETQKHDRDPECVGCHTVGLSYEGGFVGPGETPHLENVGCESCHGPAAKHVSDPATKLGTAGEASCQQCHVPLHSPRFDFAGYWARIKH